MTLRQAQGAIRQGDKGRIKYNATNTTIYFFSKDGRKYTSFSAWVANDSGLVVEAPDKYKQLLGQPIEQVQQEYKTKGWSSEAIV